MNKWWRMSIIILLLTTSTVLKGHYCFTDTSKSAAESLMPLCGSERLLRPRYIPNGHSTLRPNSPAVTDGVTRSSVVCTDRRSGPHLYRKEDTDLSSRDLFSVHPVLHPLEPAVGSPGDNQEIDLQIVDLQANASSVGRYEKFELTMDITGSVAQHLDWPYDPSPPAGLPAGTGITVEGLFSPDGWETIYVQPGFRYQPYRYEARGYGDHVYPEGDPVWKIRFAPPSTGEWSYRVRVTDASGTVEAPMGSGGSFTVESSDSKGFLHVSDDDPRYFEFDNGEPFIGVGHAEGFSMEKPIQDAVAKFGQFEQNRANFFRAWMTGDSIFGSSWWPWSSHHLDYDGYLPATSLTTEEAYADGDVSMKLWGDNPCMQQGWTGRIPVLPGRSYQVRARIKAAGVTGPAQSGAPYGFAVKLGGWLGQECGSAGVGTVVTPHVADTSGQWQTVTGSFTTDSDQYFLENLYLTLDNATGGAVYVDQVWVEEELGAGEMGPNLVRKPRMNAHFYFDAAPAWEWDRILDEAAARDVYLKLVVLEKNEWIFNRITADGPMTDDGDNNRFYAAPDTKVRWLHQAWWRYLTARWGYSTAVHSWELLNEGDPYNGNHYNQAQAFARQIHEQDPNEHMATTSHWSSFPVVEFWRNKQYPDLDYADLHAYISTGWGEYPVWGNGPSSPLAFESASDKVRGGTGHSLRVPGGNDFHNATIPPGRLGIHGRGEWIIRFWMKAEGFGGSCGYEIPDSMAGPRLMWTLDSGTPEERSNVVPPVESGQTFICSAPAGTYDWTQFDSVRTADGVEVPLSTRLVIDDDETHSLYVAVQNAFGEGGEAWIDDIEIVAPDGTVLATNGSIDLESMHTDAALYTAAYSRIYGGRSPAGAGKPLVRGESGLDHPGGPQLELEDLESDTEGVWFHNLIWGGVNAGGMYDLYWWTEHIREYDLIRHFKPFRDFMDGIPLDNGFYEAAQATTSHEDLRAWGQKDLAHGRAHLWIQNKNHTWRNVVDGVSIPALSGEVTIPGLPAGAYRVEWWDPYTGAVVREETVDGGARGLTLSPPSPLSDDLAVKVRRLTVLLDESTKSVNASIASTNSVLTYTLDVVNSGSVSGPVVVEDPIPQGTSYVPGSATVDPDVGSLSDGAGIRWEGALAPEEAVTVSFSVRVTKAGPDVVWNVATITSGTEQVRPSRATLIDPLTVHLPMILRDASTD